MTALPTTVSEPEITPAHSAATITLSSIRPAWVASGDRHPIELTNVTPMLLRELNAGAGKRSRRKTGHFRLPEVLFCKIRDARGERLWKRTLFSTLDSQYFGYAEFPLIPMT